MILKYRTSSLSSPPHSSFSYIDNISHITPSYNPSNSTLTLHLTLRTPISPYPYPIPPIPITLVLNDLAFLLTDEGKFLDKLFAPTSKSHYPTYSDNSTFLSNQTHQKFRPKSFHSYNPNCKPNSYNPNYKSNSYNPNYKPYKSNPNKKEEPE